MYTSMLMSARFPTEEQWRTAQHEGRLLLFFPEELREGVTTSQGTSDAVLCRRVVDLDAQEAYEDALIFGAALVPNIKPAIPSESVCGRLVKSEKGAWILTPHTQEDLYVAQKWIEENLT